MLVIAGVGFKTLFRLAMSKRFLGLWDHMAKVTDRNPDDPHREGDGSVPLAAATLEDVRTCFIRSVHGGLPNILAVYRDVFRWLKGDGEPLQLPDSPKAALSEHLSAEEGVSTAPHLDGSFAMSAFNNDDAGLWSLDLLPGERLDLLKAKLEAGQLPDFVRIRLL